MSSALQLVSEYYQSVIKCDRIYFEALDEPQTSSELLLSRENISLRNQVQQLTMEVTLKKEELESAKQIHKTQRALLESKLDNAKSTIRKLSGRDDSTEPESEKVKFHLLSPLQSGKSDVTERRVSKLRHVIDQGKATLFDDETDDTANRTDDVLFVNSLRTNNDIRFQAKAEKVDLNSGKGIHLTEKNGHTTELKKKRKLSNRKIDSQGFIDDENDELDSELRSRGNKIKGLFKV